MRHHRPRTRPKLSRIEESGQFLCRLPDGCLVMHMFQIKGGDGVIVLATNARTFHVSSAGQITEILPKEPPCQ